MGRVGFRRATVPDAGAIARLHLASWRDTYRDQLDPAFLETLRLDEWTDDWRARISTGSTVVLLAEERGRGNQSEPAGALGFCACGPSRDGDAPVGVWEIQNLHVDPERQGAGVGGELFRRGLALAVAQGAGTLTLWVVESNDRARRFYERRGMQLDGGRQMHHLGPSASLQEVRYRIALG